MTWFHRRYHALTWLQRYQISEYVSRSLWTLPVFGVVAALMAFWPLHGIEALIGWRLSIDPSMAVSFLVTLAAAMLTFIVFVSSSLLITVQLASAQLTPRIIGLVLQNRVTKFSLTLFVFTFTFTLVSLGRIRGGNVPLITAYVSAYSCLASLGVFLYLIDVVCGLLRPSGALGLAARRGREVIENVYPQRFSVSEGTAPGSADVPQGAPRCVIPNLRGGVVLAFDMEGLVSLAQRADCVIEMVPQVGDSVFADEPLFRIFGGGVTLPVDALYQSVAIGPERTLQQDPAFAFRIMVDIASKGLSPAINDPTTAVLAIDQIQYLLRLIGGRRLDEGRRRDATGATRLLYRTPDWEDFVYLAITEIRHFGGTSIQVVRRLRAMLEDLVQTLPQERTDLLYLELELLKRSAQRSFLEPEDQALANVSDVQGVGGKYGPSKKDGEVETIRNHPTQNVSGEK